MALTSDARNATGGGGGDRTRFEFTLATVKPTVLDTVSKTDSGSRVNSRPPTEFRPLRTTC